MPNRKIFVLITFHKYINCAFGITNSLTIITIIYTGFSFYKNQQTCESWVVWLIEAVCDPTKNNVWFLDKIRLWLQTLAENSTDEIKAHVSKLLAMKTFDECESYMDAHEAILQKRALQQHVSLPGKSGDPCKVMRFFGRIH